MQEPTTSPGTEPFQEVVAGLDVPMFVVTAASGGERSGCLVGFSTQTSIDPPRFLVCISRANHTFGVAMAADVLGVHLLRAGDHAMAERFGARTGDHVDKFAGLDVADGPGGAPVLGGLDWFAGRVLARWDGGDHVACLLEPFAGAVLRGDDAPLGYQDVTDVDPAHPA